MTEHEPCKIVARYSDGKVLKGYIYDFEPNKPRFHLVPADDPAGEGMEVWLSDLKAVFFVRTFEGNAEYSESKEFDAAQRVPGRKVRVQFADGETLVGYTMGYDPSRPGFFFIPADPQSNNLRVFAILAATRRVNRLYP